KDWSLPLQYSTSAPSVNPTLQSLPVSSETPSRPPGKKPALTYAARVGPTRNGGSAAKNWLSGCCAARPKSIACESRAETYRISKPAQKETRSHNRYATVG